MSISIIGAVAKNGVIGIKNALPWRLSADLKYFAKTTTGKSVVMGKNTFNSILEKLGQPLPNRKNYVLSKKEMSLLGATVIDDISKIKEINDEVFIIGGASIYEQTMSLANKLYITEVDCEPLGDAYFPALDNKDWNLVSEDPHLKDEKNEYNYNFKIYERK
jgi:dihydrofolate reductase